MTSQEQVELLIAFSPSINELFKIIRLAVSLWLMKKYGIIKPTSR